MISHIVRCGVNSDTDRINLPRDFWFADVQIGNRVIRIMAGDLEFLRRQDQLAYDGIMNAVYEIYRDQKRAVMLS